MEADINEGARAEEKISQYVDSLLSTCNPCHPDHDGWVRPEVHPSKLLYKDILRQNYDEDHENLLNSV